MEVLALSSKQSAEMTTGGIVSGNYFDVLKIPIAIGRGFRPEDDQAAGNPVIVLGDASGVGGLAQTQAFWAALLN
jgi:hypothetical protein